MFKAVRAQNEWRPRPRGLAPWARLSRICYLTCTHVRPRTCVVCPVNNCRLFYPENVPWASSVATWRGRPRLKPLCARSSVGCAGPGVSTSVGSPWGYFQFRFLRMSCSESACEHTLPVTFLISDTNLLVNRCAVFRLLRSVRLINFCRCVHTAKNLQNPASIPICLKTSGVL